MSKWIWIVLGLAVVGGGVWWFFFREKPKYSPLATNKPITTNSINASEVLKLATQSKPLPVNPSQPGAPNSLYAKLTAFANMKNPNMLGHK